LNVADTGACGIECRLTKAWDTVVAVVNIIDGAGSLGIAIVTITAAAIAVIMAVGRDNGLNKMNQFSPVRKKLYTYQHIREYEERNKQVKQSAHICIKKRIGSVLFYKEDKTGINLF
jgi:predicted RND superfamily exporter protein